MGGTIRALVKLVILALIVHAGVRVGPVFWNHYKFRDACQEIARFSAKRPETDVAARVMAKAAQFDIPLPDGAVKVRKQGPVTFIRADYTARLEYLPTRFYPYDFIVDIEGTPPAYETLP
jgi:hypothetical protein